MDMFYKLVENFGLAVGLLGVVLFFNYKILQFVGKNFLDPDKGIIIKWFNKQLETMDSINITQAKIIEVIASIKNEVETVSSNHNGLVGIISLEKEFLEKINKSQTVSFEIIRDIQKEISEASRSITELREIFKEEMKKIFSEETT